MSTYREIRRLILAVLTAITALSIALAGVGIVLRITEGNWLVAVLLVLAGGLALANLIRFRRNYDDDND